LNLNGVAGPNETLTTEQELYGGNSKKLDQVLPSTKL